MVKKMVSLPWLRQLGIAALRPARGVFNDPGPHHVQIDVRQTADEMVVCSNSGGMIAILPESPLSRLALIVFLGDSAGNKLHAPGDFSPTEVFQQEMDVIAGSNVIQDAEAVSFLGFEKPTDLAPAVGGKLEQEILLMTAMGDMPDMAWQKVTTCSRHFPLPLPI